MSSQLLQWAESFPPQGFTHSLQTPQHPLSFSIPVFNLMASSYLYHPSLTAVLKLSSSHLETFHGALPGRSNCLNIYVSYTSVILHCVCSPVLFCSLTYDSHISSVWLQVVCGGSHIFHSCISPPYLAPQQCANQACRWKEIIFYFCPRSIRCKVLPNF